MRLQGVLLIHLVIALIPLAGGCTTIVGGDNNNGNANDNSASDNANGNDNANDNFVEFTDPDDSTFKTKDVHDVDGDIVRFDMETNAIVWAEDGTSYQAGFWPVNGTLLGGGSFQVRFGTEGGEKMAYFTETVPATICQIEVFGSSIFISATFVQVPHN